MDWKGGGGGEAKLIYTWKVLEKMPVPSESLQENQELFRRLYSDARENTSVAYICKLPRQKQRATTSSVSNIPSSRAFTTTENSPGIRGFGLPLETASALSFALSNS